MVYAFTGTDSGDDGGVGEGGCGVGGGFFAWVRGEVGRTSGRGVWDFIVLYRNGRSRCSVELKLDHYGVVRSGTGAGIL